MKQEQRKFIDRDEFICKMADMATEEAMMEANSIAGLSIAVTALNAISVAMERVTTIESFVDVEE